MSTECIAALKVWRAVCGCERRVSVYWTCTEANTEIRTFVAQAALNLPYLQHFLLWIGSAAPCLTELDLSGIF